MARSLTELLLTIFSDETSLYRDVAVEPTEDPDVCRLYFRLRQDAEEVELQANWSEDARLICFTMELGPVEVEGNLGRVYELLNLFNLSSNKISKLAALPRADNAHFVLLASMGTHVSWEIDTPELLSVVHSSVALLIAEGLVEYNQFLAELHSPESEPGLH